MLPAWLISIHAPSRERRLSPAKVRRCAVFNPRSLAGATKLMHKFISINIFQSTLPRGSDFKLFSRCGLQNNFNPRSLAGATAGVDFKQRSRCNFNPRSLAGATDYRLLPFHNHGISIHAPSRERRRWRRCIRKTF